MNWEEHFNMGDIRRMTIGLWGLGDTTRHLLRLLAPLEPGRILIASEHSSEADIAALGDTFDNVFLRIEGGVRVGGTFFDQLLELCGAVMLLVGAGSTPRRSFAFARRHLEAGGKPVMAVATGARSRIVRSDMEVLS